MGADVVVAVDVLGDRPLGADSPVTLQMALEVIDILECDRFHRRKKETAHLVDIWLEPDLGDMNQFELKQIEFAYEQGYALAKMNAKAIKKALE